MSYLTKTEYKDITKKEAPKNFDELVELAADIVDIKTFYRIGSFLDLTDIQKKIVRKVMCYLIDILKDNIDNMYSGIKHSNLNGIQLDIENNLKENTIYIQALEMLNYTGLCYTGLC